MSLNAQHIPERLRPFSIALNGCWIWEGSVWAKRGRPRVSHEGKWVSATRLMHQSVVGSIPEGLEIDHLCMNPLCVNPAHFELVSRSENSRRAHQALQSGTSPVGHSNYKLTEGQVLEIRRSAAPCADLVARFGVSRRQIIRIRAFETWRHLVPEGEIA